MYNPSTELSSIAFDKIIGGALNSVVSAQNNASLTTVNFIKEVGFDKDENGNMKKPIYVDFKYPKEIRAFQPARPSSAYIKIESGGRGYEKDTLSDTVEVGGGVLTVDFAVNESGEITSANILSGGEGIKQSASLTLTPKSGKTINGSGAILQVVVIAAKAAEKAEFQDMTLQVPLLTMLPVPFIRIQSTDIELNVKINSISKTEESTDTKADASLNAKAGYKSRSFNASVELNASISHQKKSSATEEVKKEYSLNIKIHAVQDEMPVGFSRVLDILEESIVPKITG